MIENRHKTAKFSLSLLPFTVLWLLWALWQRSALLPVGTAAALIDSVAVKGVLWGLIPWLFLSRAKKLLVPRNELFSAPFPGLACVGLLCLTTAFLHTLRLLNGLQDTHILFDPMVLVFSLSAGVFEELAFRGYFFNRHAALMGFWPAALLNGALFTAYHYPGLLFGEGWAELLTPRTLLLFIMGVVFCWMFRKWHNLALNMTIHTVWDILSYLFCLV